MSAAPIVLPPPPAATTPWTRWWGLLLARRRRRLGARARRLPAPVISIGNLQLGGSGKTPLVAAIAAHLHAEGRRVAVLSRGYGRDTRGVRIASRGQGPEASAAEVGDEPRMLAEQLPGVVVVVAEDRYLAGLQAIAAIAPPPDVFLLDDGFSHLGLARDLDLLVFPLERPWGNGRLLPFGSLREPLAAASAAQAVILTGVQGPLDGAALPLREALVPFGFAGRAFAAGTAAGIDPPLREPRVVLATGIAHPDRAARTAHGLGVEVKVHLKFGDHHRFPQSSVERIERERARIGGAVLVTAKDRVKLEGRIAEPLHELRIEAIVEPAFWPWLDRALAAADGRSVSAPAG
jgi:tetraacyldisaccharide 4'-kinase